jgi:hypothetical protein
MRTFIGFDGHYDIYDNGKIVLRLADEIGKLTGYTKQYSNVKSIHNDADRNGVLHLLQVMRIYQTITQKV